MEPRPLINALLEQVSELAKGYPKKPINIIFEAPPGYGKTVGAIFLFGELLKQGVVSAHCHVLPLRAIVRDFYECKLLNALGGGNLEACEMRGGDGSILIDIRNLFEDLGLSKEDIAYQMGEVIEIDRKGKSPLFDARYVVTTLDSFLYNFFKFPVKELLSIRKHYAIPRLRIFLSSIYFDEAHMVLEESEDARLRTAVREMIEVISKSGIPLIISSATMSDELIKSLIHGIKMGGVVVTLGTDDREEGNIVYVRDQDFIDKASRVKWSIKTIYDRDLEDKVNEETSKGFKVFVASDTVRDAIERYKRLRKSSEYEIILLHGKLTRRDRNIALNKLRKHMRGSKPVVVMSTSVMEAGVDMSFDVLISDVSRVPSLIQRAGRVCRDLECEEAPVYVVKDKSDGDVVEFLEKNENISLRIPLDYHGVKGYKSLLNRFPTLLENSVDPDLRRLSTSLYVDMWTLNNILRGYEYSPVRAPILELILEDFEGIEDSLSVSVNVVNELISSNCVKNVVAVCDDERKFEVICDVDEIVQRSKSNLKLNLASYMKKILNYLKKEARCSELVGLMIKRECYINGIGLTTVR